MKKILSLLLGMILLYSCSTTSEGTNSNTSVVPLAPENLIGESTSTTAIHLMWTDRSTNENGFKIERKLVGGTFAVVGTTATNIATYGDSDLISGTTYVYRVYSYNTGGNSPGYSNELTLKTTIPTITIETQTWTAKNLDVATYADGTIIPEVIDKTQWAGLTTGAWCYYNNDAVTGATYGKLYNWYAVAGIWNEASKTDVTKRKKLAPTGYHIPSKDEWLRLITYLGGAAVAGGKIKETGTAHWLSSIIDSTNPFGFTALPGGVRSDVGSFASIGSYCSWWDSSETAQGKAYYHYLGNDSSAFERAVIWYNYGLSVRCLRD
jgi:uncharacterized protein (TIGR02145 family)